MPGARITDKQKHRLYHLHLYPSGPRMPLWAAAKEIGISQASAYRLVNDIRSSNGVITSDAKGPAPKAWDDLSSQAREALRDFNVFRELFFHDAPQVWAYDASMRIVQALTDSSERTFIDLNVFPGAGKTTVGLRLGCWLIAGGGTCDPRMGRSLRLMFGAETMTTATHLVKAVRNFLTLRHPFRDLERDVVASAVLSQEYGRFRPTRGYDADTQWTQSQFVVAQMTDIELYDKEPTCQAASYKSGFLGERVDLAWWDDISTTKNSKTPAVADDVETFFTKEAERRVEPGGVLVLVGQRLSALDLHAKRLQAVRKDGDRLYKHIVYPAHHDALCDGNHRQWDGVYELGHGCLTDSYRLPLADWEAVAGDRDYRTVFQQEDVDPSQVLVLHSWLEGGTDEEGFDAPGCFETDRWFGEHPSKEVGRLVEYATVDPSNTNFWAVEWWAYQPESRVNYLIWGERRKMPAGGHKGLLDWDNTEQRFIGLMEEMQRSSVVAGHPIKVWVIETNIAQRHLLDYEHYRRWRRAWPDVQVLRHQTQMNKLDPDYGVTILSQRYRSGLKRIPWHGGTRERPAMDGRNFLRAFVRELTTYPFAETDDCVMADWMGEYNLPRIIAAAKRDSGERLIDQSFPGYLQARRQDFALNQPA